MPYRSILIAAVQTAGLTIAGFVIPLLGQIAVLFTPVPLIALTVREGRKAGFAATGLAAAMVAVVVSGQLVFVFFFFSFGLMALGISEGLLRRLRPEQAVLAGGILPLAALTAALVPLLIRAGKSPLALADEYLRTSLIEAQQLYTQLGLNEVAQMISAVPETTLYYAVRLGPGIVLATTLLQAAVCFGMARTVLLRKDPGLPISGEPALAAWHAPDSWVWGLIASLGLLVVPGMTSRLVGMNLTLLFLLVYIAQGAALTEFWLRRLKLSILWRSFAHTIILTLPPTMAVVIALGVVDIWADFRKVRGGEPAGSPP